MKQFVDVTEIMDLEQYKGKETPDQVSPPDKVVFLAYST